MHIAKRLVLASGSPRRQQLLRQIGLTFDVIVSSVAEDLPVHVPPQDVVSILADRKAKKVSSLVDDAIVLGADTIVVLGKKIFGKPGDPQEAASMLQELSGNTHEVFTGFALVDQPSGYSVVRSETTRVTFRSLTSTEISQYVRSGSPMDKAGAYGIQDDYGAVFVERIEGCFYNVVGLPLARLVVTLQEFQQQLGLKPP